MKFNLTSAETLMKPRGQRTISNSRHRLTSLDSSIQTIKYSFISFFFAIEQIAVRYPFSIRDFFRVYLVSWILFIHLQFIPYYQTRFRFQIDPLRHSSFCWLSLLFVSLFHVIFLGMSFFMFLEYFRAISIF